MSERPTTNGTEGTGSGGVLDPITPAAVEAILADFRAWLRDRASPDDHVGADASSPPSPEVDLFTLVGQFTALRHEVNLQTKAARAAVDQSAELLKQLAAAPTAPGEDDETLRPVAKAIIDIADALALSLRQMEKFRETVDELLAPSVASPPEPLPQPGFFARLFGAKSAAPAAAPISVDDKLRPLASSAADGYALSLRRVERLLPSLELEPFSCTGEAFDPEIMEVVEVLADSDEPPGTVVEEVRPGYLWRGRLLRYAQVKVAR